METVKQNNKSKKILAAIPSVIVMICAILMVVAIFLPYSTAVGSMGRLIEKNPDAMVYKELNMAAKDMKDLTLIEYARIYSTYSQTTFGNPTQGNLYWVFLALIGIFSLLTLLFALLRKHIPCAIFNALALAVYMIQNADYSDRGIIPNGSYDWGVGCIIFIISAIVAVTLTVWILTNKPNPKKQA